MQLGVILLFPWNFFLFSLVILLAGRLFFSQMLRLRLSFGFVSPLFAAVIIALDVKQPDTYLSIVYPIAVLSGAIGIYRSADGGLGKNEMATLIVYSVAVLSLAAFARASMFLGAL